ncbi:MAG: flagellar biosynthesis protein FliR [Micromonosporaceae bacterium]|nr:flagellar biosynthesis protein FliR [Micromonosporaceae bacterium]
MDVPVATATLTAFLLASTRAAAWLVMSPPFSSGVLPGRIKALLAAAIAAPVVPSLVDKVPALDTFGMVASVAEQMVLGTVLGFLTSMVFAAIKAAGDLIDLFGGFSVAFAFDPLGASGSSGGGPFGRFYNVMAITLLFATDGHQLILRGFTNSYRVLPLNGALSLHDLQHLVTNGLVEMFASAIQIAGPLVAVLFCTDIGLGLLSRVAPALNAFSLGFPAKILLTLGGAGIALSLLPQVVSNIVTEAVRLVLQVVGS